MSIARGLAGRSARVSLPCSAVSLQSAPFGKRECAYRNYGEGLALRGEMGQLGILTGYAAWMAARAIARRAQHGLHIETWALIGCSGVLVMLAGVACDHRVRRLPWLVGGT